MDFCHLHLHSEYSMLDGLGTTRAYAAKAKKLGFKYLALTDHGSIDGLIKFQQSCEAEGIKPILGCELYIVKDPKVKTRKRGHIVVLVKNQEGFQNLCDMLTYANTDGFYYKPRVSHEVFLKHCKGLVVSTACLQSFMLDDGGKRLFRKLHHKIGDDLYLEIMAHDVEKQRNLNALCYKLAKRYGHKVIATNDCHYINRTHTQAHEVLLAIQNKARWTDLNRWRFSVTGLYLKSEKEMKQAFKQQGYYNQRYLHNTLEVAEKCSDFRIERYPIKLPRVKGIKIKEEVQSLEYLCHAGYKKIFGKQLQLNNLYYDRFKEEFDLIRRKKFVRYFLIVWDLVKWCKENDIMTGPLRGSVGGSLVSYLLGITTVDPINHNLMFSRFISEDRTDLPDIDIDFEDRKRHLIRGRLEDLYGEDNVAGVSSYNRMKARAVIRDVSRVFDIPLAEVDQFAKLVEDNDDHTGLQDAIDEYPECQEFAQKYPNVIRHAKKLEGQIKTYSQHAAAVVVSREPIGTSGRCNLLERKGIKLINWEKNDTEYVGLIKLDILGLKLLSVLNDARDAIWINHKTKVNFDKIDLNDKKVLNELNEGNTVGVFQFNPWATKNLLKEIHADNFQHLADTSALVRPGPYASGMTAEYIKRKHGATWEKKHRIYERITKSTFGLLVYQEQVMAVISKVAGLPYSMADKIRKVIGKKRNVAAFKQYEKEFLNGCKKTKIFDRAEAREFWTGLQAWASYGYNRCLTGDTILRRGNWNQYTGSTVTIEDFYLQWNTKRFMPYRKTPILQMYDDKRVRPCGVKDIFYQGKRMVYRVTTKSGKSIKGTKNHRLFSYNQYKTISELRVGDYLAIAGSYEPTDREREGQTWRKTYEGQGFPKGNQNPSYTNGKWIRLKRAKKIVRKRSKNKCELCQAPEVEEAQGLHNHEFAHINALHEFDGNYTQYHSPRNILFLCNSCHKKLDIKKGERPPRYAKGFPVYWDKIVSIEYCGIEPVYDIEMVGENHNFVANDIISHNSHAVGYSILGYWCGWLKLYYPTEFICAALTYGAKDKKTEMVEEAYRLGLTIVLPKVGISAAENWIARGDKLYVPFVEVSGIGPVKAIQACRVSGKSSGTMDKYFNRKKETVRHKGQFGKLLEEIGAYNPQQEIQITNKIKERFNFRIVTDPKENYKKLYQMFKKKIRLDKMDKLLAGNIPEIKKLTAKKKVLRHVSFEGHDKLYRCKGCELYKECTRPVPPSPGKYNIFIIGEGPWIEEDEAGECFVGRAGNMLWKSLKGYDRSLFHVTNIWKCFPSLSRKANKDQIEICTQWLDAELREVKPILILGFGNYVLKYFTNKSGGITDLSGSTTWNEQYGAWIAWCLHPAGVLHNPDNEPYYRSGIRNFKKLLKAMGRIV